MKALNMMGILKIIPKEKMEQLVLKIHID